MKDLQAIYVRDVAELDDIEIASMVRIEDVDVSAISDVRLNGVSAKFFPLGIDTLMVSIPASFQDYQDLESDSPGYVAQSINNITITRKYTGTDGVEREHGELIKWAEGSTIDTSAPSGSKRVTLDGGVIRLYGKGFDKAVRVLVNNKDQPFLLEGSGGTILTAIPENDRNLETVDVITTSKTVNRMTFFEYLLGQEMGTVSGTFKLVQQFIKLMMTTPGSDAFGDRSMGGNMQNWVGQKVNMRNPQGLVAKTVLNIVTLGTKMQIQQLQSNVPPTERLSDVTVLNAALSPNDPSIMELSIKLNTYAGRQAFFSLLIGQAQDAVNSAADSFNTGSLF